MHDKTSRNLKEHPKDLVLVKEYNEIPDTDVCVTPPLEAGSTFDQGRSWFVLAAAFSIFFLQMGLMNSFGEYFVEIMDEFDCSEGEAAFVGSISFGIMSFCSVLAAYLYRVLGARIVVMLGGLLATLGYLAAGFSQGLSQLYLSYSLVGVGYGLTSIAICAVQLEYFQRWKFFALSFATVGSGMGSLAFPPVINIILRDTNWRGSMLINALLSTCIILAGGIMRSRRPKQFNVLFFKVFNFCIFENKYFVLICVGCLMWGGSIATFYIMVDEVLLGKGLSPSEAAIQLSVIGATNALARVLSAVLNSLPQLNRTLFYFATSLVWAATVLVMASTPNDMPSLLLIECAVFGLGYGLMVPTLNPVLVELFGDENLASCQAIEGITLALGGVSVPLMGGWLAAASGDIDVTFYLAGGCGVSFVAVNLLIVLLRQCLSPEKS